MSIERGSRWLTGYTTHSMRTAEELNPSTAWESDLMERGKVEHVVRNLQGCIGSTIHRCMLRTFLTATRTVHRTLPTRTYLMSSDQTAKRMKSTKVSYLIFARTMLILGHRYPLGNFPL